MTTTGPLQYRHYPRSEPVSDQQRDFIRVDINEPSIVKVHVPQGKWYLADPQHNVSIQQSQTTMGCVLYARRMIGTRYGKGYDNDSRERLIERTMNKFRNTIQQLTRNRCNRETVEDMCEAVTRALTKLGINWEDELINSPFYQDPIFAPFFINATPAYKKFFINAHFNSTVKLWKQYGILYEMLLKNTMGNLQLTSSNWSKSQGPEGLMQALREHGPHLFVGKFGNNYGIPQEQPTPELSDRGRDVFGCKPGSYDPNKQFTHAIVVDEIRKINDKYYVIYQDPADQKIPGQSGKAHVLTYNSFVSRLCNLGGYKIPEIQEQAGWHPEANSARMSPK